MTPDLELNLEVKIGGDCGVPGCDGRLAVIGVELLSQPKPSCSASGMPVYAIQFWLR